MKISILIFVMFLVIVGCGDKGNNRLAMMSYQPVEASKEVALENDMMAGETATAESGPQAEVVKKKLIRDGNMTIKTGDIQQAKTFLDTLIRAAGGYLSSESFNDQESLMSYSLSVRIPAEQFDPFLASLEKGPGTIEAKSIQARDVTEEYYDMKARLETRREVEKSYRALLVRASTIKDILDVEERLGQVREEIESAEGQLRFLDDRVSYSSLEIYLYQPKELKYRPGDRDPFGQRLLRSLHKGWLGFIDVLLLLLRLWPFLLLIPAGWWMVRYFRRRARKNKT